MDARFYSLIGATSFTVPESKNMTDKNGENESSSAVYRCPRRYWYDESRNVVWPYDGTYGGDEHLRVLIDRADFTPISDALQRLLSTPPQERVVPVAQFAERVITKLEGIADEAFDRFMASETYGEEEVFLNHKSVFYSGAASVVRKIVQAELSKNGSD